MNKNAFISLAATAVILLASAGAATAGDPAAGTAGPLPANGPVQLAYLRCFDDGWCCEQCGDENCGGDGTEPMCWVPSSYRSTDPVLRSLHPSAPEILTPNHLPYSLPGRPAGKTLRPGVANS